jgi:hypothetical protein
MYGQYYLRRHRSLGRFYLLRYLVTREKCRFWVYASGSSAIEKASPFESGYIHYSHH